MMFDSDMNWANALLLLEWVAKLMAICSYAIIRAAAPVKSYLINEVIFLKGFLRTVERFRCASEKKI